jgi:dUTP pyrophosphatase
MQYIVTDIGKKLELYKNGLQVATAGSAGIDLYAAIETPIVLSPEIPTAIRTGLKLFIEDTSLVGILLPRSSSTFRLFNTAGVIDSDYQGELIVNAISNYSFGATIAPKAKFAQLVLLKKPTQPLFEEVTEFSSVTERGAGGFGSTGA